MTFVQDWPEYIAFPFRGFHSRGQPFANLLTSELFRGSSFYDKWKDAFPLVYGVTVEQNAQLHRERRFARDVFG